MTNMRKKCTIPYRYVVSVMMFLGLMITFSMRVNLSVAIVAMVSEDHSLEHNQTLLVHDVVHLTNDTTSHKNDPQMSLAKTFTWDVKTQAKVLASFYYLNGILQFAWGIAVQRFGAKSILAMTTFLSSLLTLTTEVTADYSVIALQVNRALQGAMQASLLVCTNVLIARWAPVSERTRTYTFVYAGQFAGNVLGTALSGVLANSGFLKGWPSVFYVFGAMGLVWLILYVVLVKDTPSQHPWVSEKELKYITNDTNEDKTVPSVPWRAILTSIKFWAAVIAMGGQYWDFYLLMSDLPKYMSNVLHFEIEESGLAASVPHFLQAVFSLAGSYVADKMIQSGKYNVTFVRKLINTFGSSICGVLFIVLPFVGPNPTLNVALISAGSTFASLAMAGVEVSAIDMSPTYAGITTGIMGTSVGIVGFIVPFVIGELTYTGETFENWKWVFIITGVVTAASGFLFCLLGSAEVQPWDPLYKGTNGPHDIQMTELEDNTQGDRKDTRCEEKHK